VKRETRKVSDREGMEFSAVILAGGRSSRMGSDKAWLPFNGRTLLARQIELVRELAPTEVFISGRADTDYASCGGRVLTDRFPEAGPLAGIERALNACASPLLLVLAVDMPHLRAEFLGRLLASCAGEAGVIPCHQGRIEPLVAFYPRASWRLLVNLIEERSPVFPSAAKTAGGKGLPVAGEHSSNSPSVTRFAELCVEVGLARFHALSAGDARCCSNWNSPADLPQLPDLRTTPAVGHVPAPHLQPASTP